MLPVSTWLGKKVVPWLQVEAEAGTKVTKPGAYPYSTRSLIAVFFLPELEAVSGGNRNVSTVYSVIPSSFLNEGRRAGHAEPIQEALSLQ